MRIYLSGVSFGRVWTNKFFDDVYAAAVTPTPVVWGVLNDTSKGQRCNKMVQSCLNYILIHSRF